MKILEVQYCEKKNLIQYNILYFQERARLAAQAMESFSDRRRRKREDKNSTKFVDNVETDLEMTNEVFSCPVCEAVFSR